MRKIVLIIIDGLGDRPVKKFNNKTPLESAKTPNMDFLASSGKCGLIEPYIKGTAIPTSEQAHFTLFGYDCEKYNVKRGIFTARGVGIKLKKGDVALRGNFSTVDDKMNLIDRRAGRIEKTDALVKKLNGTTIDKVKFIIRNTGGYRLGIVLRGRNLSSNISDGDPFYASLKIGALKIRALDKSVNARFTADVLNKFLKKAHEILKNHPVNLERKKKGLLVANYVLTRGASSPHKVPSFGTRYGLKAACIAGKFLYKEIGKFLGMDLIEVKGANGLPNTNLKGKFRAVKKCLKKYNFVFLHIKAIDSLAEDGNCIAKRDFIEKIDKELGALIKIKDTSIVITCDHATCCELKHHCKELIPILMHKGNGKNELVKFCEKNCKSGELGRFPQIKLMSRILDFSKNK